MEITPAVAAKPRRLRAALIVVLLAFAAGIGVALAFVRYYSHLLPSAMQPEPVNMPAAPQTRFVPPPERGIGQQGGEADAVTLRQRGLAAELANLEARAMLIDREAQGAASQAGRAEALLLAIAARRAIDRGAPLGPLDAALRARFAASQPRAVAVLAEAGRVPVTLSGLRALLDQAEAEQAATDITGFWNALQRQLGSLIIIHREGTPSPRPADRLERVNRAIDAGHVDTALAEARRLPQSPALDRWMAEAKRYADAHQALDVIELAALQTPAPAPVITPAPVPVPATPAPEPKAAAKP